VAESVVEARETARGSGPGEVNVSEAEKLFGDLMGWLHRKFPFERELARGIQPPSETVLELSRQFGRLADRYFQIEVYGAEKIPREGGALLVSNHGFLAVESAVTHSVVLRHAGRAVRPVAAHMAWDVPLFNQLVAASGGVQGDATTVVELLKAGELVLVYPGGVREAAKGPRDREKLFWEGRRGFIRTALRAGVPIIPAGISGADDVYIRLNTRLGPLARLLGDKDAAIPLFVGFGLFPLPAPLTFRFGEPLQMEHGPEAADDEAVVDQLQARVRQAVEELLALEDRSRRATAPSASDPK
jgi:1-acyl-sn-glycerol-3-phosphate acyltransferase